MSKPHAPRVSPADLASDRPEKPPTTKDFTHGQQLLNVQPLTETTRWDAVRALTGVQQRQPMPLGDVRLILAMLDLDPVELRGLTAPTPVQPPAGMSVLDSACPVCEAAPGLKCVTRAGKEAPSVHASRWRIWKEQR